MRDVCEALETMMSSGTPGEVYNIASPDEFSVNQVFDILKTATGSKSEKLNVSDRPYNDQRYHIDCSKLLELGWAPKVTWEDGLTETIAWYREHGATYWRRKPRWLMYGARGWIGQKYCSIAAEHVELIHGKARANCPEAVRAEMDAVGAEHVVCIIGRTHGPGCGTIDWLEQPGHLRYNVRDNLFAPFVLATECHRRGIKMTYMGTGCIFKFTDEQKIFTEEDLPNFFGSSYSIVKGFTDQMMKLVPRNGFKLPYSNAHFL